MILSDGLSLSYFDMEVVADDCDDCIIQAFLEAAPLVSLFEQSNTFSLLLNWPKAPTCISTKVLDLML